MFIPIIISYIIIYFVFCFKLYTCFHTNIKDTYTYTKKRNRSKLDRSLSIKENMYNL